MVQARAPNSVGVGHSSHYRPISYPIHTWLHNRRCVLLSTLPLESCCKLPWRSTLLLCLLALLGSMVVSCHKLHFQWRRRALARQLGLCTCCGYYACRIRLSRTASGGLRSSSACCPLAEPWLPQVEHIMFCSRQAVVLACRAPVLFWKRSCVGLHRILPRGTSQHRFLMMIMGQSGHLKSAQGLCASCGVPGRRFQPSRVHHRPP